jgi:hypothetical protein
MRFLALRVTVAIENAGAQGTSVTAGEPTVPIRAGPVDTVAVTPPPAPAGNE